MKLNYIKHERDYTVTFTSIVLSKCFDNDFLKIFPIKTHPMYIWIEDDNLCHFVPEENYSAWPNSWLKNNSLSDLIKYEKEINKIFIEHNRILKAKHENLLESLNKIHQLARDFLPIVIISAYVPMYCSHAPKKLIDQCLKYRKKYEDVHKNGITLERKLFSRLEKQLNITKGVLQFLTIEEFNQFSLVQELPKNINKRKAFFFVEYSNRGVSFYPKAEAIQKLKIINPAVDKNIKELKGSVAYKGMVRGKIRVIKAIKEVNKLRAGEILVTAMTDPRYVPAMKRASAIITDEGGITCHAAIVVRELKKPCVIGTKVATQVLKNGQQIEVDANKGLIKII